MSCRFAHDDAAYVLGALAATERLEFERHLADCAECGRRVQQLAGLPGLLATVPADAVAEVLAEDGPSSVGARAVPATVLPSLVAEVRRTQRRRRWAAVGAAAAAVALVAAGAVAWLTGGDEPTAAPPSEGSSPSAPASTAPARPMQRVQDTTMTARVSLSSVPWGTRLDLSCSYPTPEGRPGYSGGDGGGGATYSLVVRSRDGATQQVATWRGLPDRTMQLTAATALTVDEIAAVQVRDAGGSTVLRLSG